MFKGLDILIGDLDILNTLPLFHKLLHGLLAVMDFRILGLRHVLSQGPFQKVGGQLAAGLAYSDCQGDGFIPYFVLHGDLPPFCKRRRAASAGLAALGPAFWM